MNTIANQDVAKVLGRVSECMRRLLEAGLTYEDLQSPIDDPEMRERLVRYWKNPITALARNTILVDRSMNFDFLFEWCKSWGYDRDVWRILPPDDLNKDLKEVDLNAVKLEHGIVSRDHLESLRERLNNLESSERIFLDAHVCRVLWDNPRLIPEAWKRKINGRNPSILFAGTRVTDLSRYDNRWYNILRLSYLDNRWVTWYENSENRTGDESEVFATLSDFRN